MGWKCKVCFNLLLINTGEHKNSPLIFFNYGITKRSSMTKKAYSKRMEKYYYYANDWGSCKERCIVLDNGIMIGSVKCQVCKFNKGHNLKEQWIKCEQINKWIVQKR